MNDFQKLFKKDQGNIKLFKSGEINATLFKNRTERNIQSFLQIVKENGFPKHYSDPETYRMAITLLLHTPLNELRRIYNKIKIRDVRSLLKSDVAYITDRINILDGKKQVFGTNYKITNERIVFLPIENRSGVNDRREKMGLCSLNEYRKFIRGKRDNVNF